jgi:hypothetical protein
VGVTAMRHIRRMRGGAQAHLLQCSDNHFYVVKFGNNPQHPRVLANEWLATRLAEAVGLPVPPTEVVEVDDCLIGSTRELVVQLAQRTVPCQSGSQFGSRYAVNPMEGQVFDYLPMEWMDRVRNLRAFSGVLALDKWTGNADFRQAAFWRRSRERRYTAIFIDQGYCFNAGEWTFPDCPLRGVYARDEVYASVTGWESFEPWLCRIEQLDERVVWEIARSIPSEWYANEWDALERMVSTLIRRRRIVRDLIQVFRNSNRRPFPDWYGQGGASGLLSMTETA